MKLVMDVSAGVNVPAGLGRYTRSLLTAMRPQLATPPSVFYNHIEGRSQPFAAMQDVPQYRVAWGYKPWRLACWLGNLTNAPFNRLVPGADVFHATEHLLMPLRGVKTILTVHDLIFHRFPEHHKRLNYLFLNRAMPLFVRRADAIIAISEATKRDLITLYGTPEQKIHVIYEAADAHFHPAKPEQIAEVRQRYNLPERFILTVGTIEPRKNYARLLEALIEVRNNDPALQWVIVGGKGWLYEPFMAQLAATGAQEWVHFPGFVPDADLPALYSAATLYVMASVYEGFGLPILEGMACGAPVVSSNAASLPELGGQAARYFNPLDVRDMHERLAAILASPAEQATMRAQGLHQAHRFSGERTASETINLYETVTGKNLARAR